jgi:hypothetical protein
MESGGKPAGAVDYRMRYPWQGRDTGWSGTFAADPVGTGLPMKIGVFSCDNGYAFPLPAMVRNVKVQNPDLLFFAGDQIYESYGGLGIVRAPVEKAMLDYLRKYYQFGWTWRESASGRDERAPAKETAEHWHCHPATIGIHLASWTMPLKRF